MAHRDFINGLHLGRSDADKALLALLRECQRFMEGFRDDDTQDESIDPLLDRIAEALGDE